MNKAFIKDDDGAGDALPDREIPSQPNLVTAEGLVRIEQMLAQASTALSEAQAVEDRAAVARAARDVRYWAHRRASAQLVPPPADHTQVRFGARVTIARDDEREQTFRIVGMDEADPAAGTLSYVSPMAQALMGRAVGDAVRVAGGEVEIVAIA
jgi:transcription elongation GreA/GreB family factor